MRRAASNPNDAPNGNAPKRGRLLRFEDDVRNRAPFRINYDAMLAAQDAIVINPNAPTFAAVPHPLLTELLAGFTARGVAAGAGREAMEKQNFYPPHVFPKLSHISEVSQWGGLGWLGGNGVTSA